MTDNVAVTPGSGVTVATKDLGGGVQAQRVQQVFGGAGIGIDVSPANPLPVAPSLATGAATGAKQDTGNSSLVDILTKLGGVILAAGSAVIGKVGIQVGGSDVAAGNPVPTTNSEARAFQGVAASTVGPFPATTTSANAAIGGLTNGGQVRVANTGSAPVRIAWGTSNTAAATAPTPGTLTSGTYSGGAAGSKVVPAGGVEVLSAPAGTTYVAFKTDVGTSTIEFTPGAGV